MILARFSNAPQAASEQAAERLLDQIVCLARQLNEHLAEAERIEKRIGALRRKIEKLEPRD